MRRFAALSLLAAGVALAGEPKVDFSELENGLDVLVVEKHGTPLVTIEIAVKTGSFTETPETNGLSHMYEHMFFKGNEALPTQEAYMARKAELGIEFNGTTSTERVNYFITLPARNFARGMEFMADALLTPLFEQSELDREEKIVISEYDRNEANPEHYLWKGLRQAMYGDQAYRKNPLGERAVIEAATKEIMLDFKRRFYVPNNAALVIVGDVNPTEARVLAERLFGPRRWASGPNPHSPPREPLPRLAGSKAFVSVQATKNVVLALQWPGPDVGRDERATFVADVWGTLCDLPHARFQRAFRDKELTDAVGLHYYTQREGGEVNFRATVRGGKVLETRDTLLAELEAMAEPGYWTADQIALAKRNLAIMRAYEGESGPDFAHTLTFWWASSSYDYYLRYLEETASVGPEELAGFVKHYLLGRPMVVGCLLGAEAQKALDLTEAKLLPPARSAEAAGVEELSLDGMQVLVRRQPGSTVTALDVYLRDTCFDLPADQQGIDLLLVNTVVEGSAKTSRAEVQAKLLGHGARVTQEANYDFARLSLVAPAGEFQGALATFAECLTQPLFDAKVVAERKSQMLTALNAERQNLDAWLPRVANEAYFAGHPYALRPDGTPETVGKLDAEALRRRLAQFDRQRVLLVLVGDLDAAAARALLGPAFGAVPTAKRPWPATRDAGAKLPPFQPSRVLAHDARDIPKTYLMGKADAPAPGDPDYPAVKLLATVLRQRLWESLRTKHALTYAPGAGLSIFRRNYSVVVVGSTGDPVKAVSLIHQEMKRLAAEPITPAELAGMVATQETAGWGRIESAAAHAQALGRAELSGGGWRNLYEEPRHLAAVTPADLQKAAAKWLRGYTWGVIGKTAPSEAELRGESP